MAKRKHDNCLASENLRDGTKERCYEAILQKHLSDDEYQAAIARERLTKLQPPKIRARVMERLGTLERPKLLGNALRLMRRVRAVGRPPQTNTDMDLRTAAFLTELESIDYGLISRTPNSFTIRSVTKTTRRPSK